MYTVLADGVGRLLSVEELDELIRRLDRAGLVQRDPASGAVIRRSPSALAAAALRSQRDEGKTLLTIPRKCRGSVLDTLHPWVGDAKSWRLLELRYALYNELAAEDRAA